MADVKRYDDKGRELEEGWLVPRVDYLLLKAWTSELEGNNAVLARRVKELEHLLREVKSYHEWVSKEHIWHLEANAQVGLFQMLGDLERALGDKEPKC